jgi:peroxiredoxin
LNKEKKNLVIFLLVIAVAISVIYFLAKNIGLFSGGEQDITSGQRTKAPDFNLSDVKGDEHRLSDYRGSYVIINFWGSWCKYCVEEMPDFQKANDTFEKAGDTVILSVNDTSTELNMQTALDFINLYRYDMLFLFDTDGTVADTYRVSGYPTTYIIDKKGYIYTYGMGAISESDLYSAIDALRMEDK